MLKRLLLPASFRDISRLSRLQLWAPRVGFAYRRWLQVAVVCGNGLQRTREASRGERGVQRRVQVHTRRWRVIKRRAEWQLTPGGRSRPRLVSGRGPAVRLGRIGRRPYPLGVSGLPRPTSSNTNRLLSAAGCGEGLQRTRDVPDKQNKKALEKPRAL